MPGTAARTLRQILNFPLVRIIVGIALLNVGLFILRNLTELALDGIHLNNETVRSTCLFIIRIAGLIFLYILYVRMYEKRKPSEISLSGSTAYQILFGAVTSLACITLVIGINWIFGWITIEKINDSPDILRGLYYTLFFVLLQDFVYFLIIFRITEKYLGTYFTILITGLIFGFKHLLFPEYTFLNGLIIFIAAAFIFSALFIRSRSLWRVFGFHFMYNFLQSTIFGNPGNENLQSLFTIHLNGPPVLTGNEAGFESSIIVLIFCIVLGGYYLNVARKKGRFLDPFWKKS